MAKQLTYELPNGLTVTGYVRLNNFQTISKTEAVALFRAFASAEAFKAGKNFVDEFEVSFAPDVTRSLWEQAYAALGSYEPEPTAKQQQAAAASTLEIAQKALADAKAELEAWRAPSSVPDAGPPGELSKAVEDAQAQIAHAEQMAKDAAALEAKNETWRQVVANSKDV